MSRNILVLASLLVASTVACGGSTDTTDPGSSGPPGSGGSGAVAGSTGTGGKAGAGGSKAGAGGSAGSGATAGSAGKAGGTGGSATGGSATGGSAGAGAGPVAGSAGVAGAGPECSTSKECPQFDNGTQGYCVGGQCIYKPINPCQGLACGAFCNPCPPDQDCPAVVYYCDANGQCSSPQPPTCSGGQCKDPSQCPVPEAPCKQCPNGVLSCPEATCVGGQCGVQYSSCEQPNQCKDASQCPQPKGPCLECPGGGLSCPQASCENGQCGVQYGPCQGGGECTSPKECPVPEGCLVCPDGSLSCPQATCEQGKCGVFSPPCGDPPPPQCKSDFDCPLPPCEICPDGTQNCPVAQCLQNQCVYSFSSCPVSNCSPVPVKADPSCKKLLGFFWNGSACESLVGCQCFGECDQLSATQADCEKIHATCPGTGGQCVSDFDCPVPGGPCQICPDGTAACPSAKCIGGQCLLEMGTCPVPSSKCDAQDAVGVGACKKLLGFAWNGKDCQSVTGCECQGADCGQLGDSYKQCINQHQTCLAAFAACSGKTCGQPCTTCTGDVCPPVFESCNIKGKCTTEAPVCTFP